MLSCGNKEFSSMKPLTWLNNWKEKAKGLERQVFALYLAFRHPGTPWYAKALALAVTAYALSPVDLIPDFIPVLGYLDDLLIVPGGVMLVFKLVPSHVMTECQSRAAEMQGAGAPQFRWMGLVVVLLWLVALAFIVVLVMSLIRR
jgi:uncharacterized membrane protein YkvA (DUF1232 family)